MIAKGDEDATERLHLFFYRKDLMKNHIFIFLLLTLSCKSYSMWLFRGAANDEKASEKAMVVTRESKGTQTEFSEMTNIVKSSFEKAKLEINYYSQIIEDLGAEEEGSFNFEDVDISMLREVGKACLQNTKDRIAKLDTAANSAHEKIVVLMDDATEPQKEMVKSVHQLFLEMVREKRVKLKKREEELSIASATLSSSSVRSAEKCMCLLKYLSILRGD